MDIGIARSRHRFERDGRTVTVEKQTLIRGRTVTGEPAPFPLCFILDIHPPSCPQLSHVFSEAMFEHGLSNLFDTCFGDVVPERTDEEKAETVHQLRAFLLGGIPGT